MTPKRTCDRQGHAHLVTSSSGFRRRRPLDHDRPRKVVRGVLNSRLARRRGQRIGFVVRPDHVHAIAPFPDPDPISRFRKRWKQRGSVPIERLFRGRLSSFAQAVDLAEPVRQARHDDFNLFSTRKVEGTRLSMPQDPVRAGLAAHPCDWPRSSARHDERGRTVGVAVGWLDGTLVARRDRGQHVVRATRGRWR